MFGDVDMDKCLPVMVRSSFINQGEICLTTSRIYVHESVYDTFIKRFVELTKLVACVKAFELVDQLSSRSFALLNL